MGMDIRNVKDMTGLILYFADKLQWKIDPDDFDDIEDVAYDFEAEDRLYVEQMIEPIIMDDEKVLKTGTAILGRIEE